MKTEQVIEGIGKAVAATQPTQEYCLFWLDWWPMCMTKSEWSGWVQAIGAILAIIGAFYLSKIQEKSNRKRSQESAVLKVKAFVAAVKSIADVMNVSNSFEVLDVQRHQAYIREILSSSSSIEAEVLNSQWILAFQSSRLIATQLVVLCEEILKNPKNLPEVLVILSDYCDHLLKVDKVVAGSHPGVVFKNFE